MMSRQLEAAQQHVNNPAHSIAVLNCGGNANRPELSHAVPSRTTQWKSTIRKTREVTVPILLLTSDSGMNSKSAELLSW